MPGRITVSRASMNGRPDFADCFFVLLHAWKMKETIHKKIVILRNGKTDTLQYEFFIAKRLIKAHGNKDKLSGPIVKIAIGSIALSILVMLLSVAAGKGLQRKIKEKVAAFSGHALILPYNNNHSQLTLEPVRIPGNGYKNWYVEGVRHIAPFATIGGLLKKGDDFEGIILKGVDSAYDWRLFKPYLKTGKIPAFGRGKSADSILISQWLANRLKLKTGDKVLAYFIRRNASHPLVRRFFVAGIYETGFEDYDRNYVIGDLRRVRKLYGWNDTLTGGFEIMTPDFNQVQNTVDRLNEALDPELIAMSLKDLNPYLFDWLDMFDFNIIIIIVILIFVSALNMATVVLVMIMERTRFIGIMKTLGAQDNSLRKIFLLKAAYLIVSGLFFGNILGLAIVYLQNRFGFIRLNPEIYYVKIAPLFLTWTHWLELNLLVLVSVLILMLLPVAIITRISPVRAIKWD